MLMRMRKELMANKFHSYVSLCVHLTPHEKYLLTARLSYVVYGRKPDGKSRADA